MRPPAARTADIDDPFFRSCQLLACPARIIPAVVAPNRCTSCRPVGRDGWLPWAIALVRSLQGKDPVDEVLDLVLVLRLDHGVFHLKSIEGLDLRAGGQVLYELRLSILVALEPAREFLP